MPGQINHREVPIRSVEGRHDHGEDEAMMARLYAFYDQALFASAGAVYATTGSLEKVASALAWVGFTASAEDEDAPMLGEEAIQAWVEENQERIVEASEGELSRSVAGLE